MLTVLIRAFRVPGLRRKILFTLAMVVLFRTGQILPAPGVNVVAARECLSGTRGGLVDEPVHLLDVQLLRLDQCQSALEVGSQVKFRAWSVLPWPV